MLELMENHSTTLANLCSYFQKDHFFNHWRTVIIIDIEKKKFLNTKCIFCLNVFYNLSFNINHFCDMGQTVTTVKICMKVPFRFTL